MECLIAHIPTTDHFMMFLRAALKGEPDDSVKIFLFLFLLHLNKISSHWGLSQNK